MFGPPLLLAQGTSVRQYIGGLLGRWLCSVRLPYFHTNRLLIVHYKQETEIR
jgi:hypothetical protein